MAFEARASSIASLECYSTGVHSLDCRGCKQLRTVTCMPPHRLDVHNCKLLTNIWAPGSSDLPHKRLSQVHCSGCPALDHGALHAWAVVKMDDDEPSVKLDVL